MQLPTFFFFLSIKINECEEGEKNCLQGHVHFENL